MFSILENRPSCTYNFMKLFIFFYLCIICAGESGRRERRQSGAYTGREREESERARDWLS